MPMFLGFLAILKNQNGLADIQCTQDFMYAAPRIFSSFRYERNPIRLLSYASTSEDPVAFYAIMSTSAILRSIWHNLPDSPRGMQYKAQAMQIINERMKNTAQRRSSDLIVGVTMLAAAEVGVCVSRHLMLSALTDPR